MRALAAVAVLAAVATVGWASAADPGKATWTTTLLASRSIDIGPRGPGIGDGLIRKWRLTDREGKAVGFGYDDCRWMSSMILRCSGTYSPPGGSIDVAGMVGDGSPLAVTGGTGRYVGARGEVTRNGRTITFVFAP